MMNPILAQFVMTVVFVTAVGFHIAKKNQNVARLYGLQSLVIVVLLGASFLERGSLALLVVALFTLTVKVVLAPLFFMRLINQHQLKFTVKAFLNTPLTLAIVAIISALVSSKVFVPITQISPGNAAYLSLALSAMLISIFLMINGRGALSQAIGILSLENSIVAFAVFSGLEQSPALQLGIMFDIFVWLIIATVFVSMIYKHYGSVDVSSMKHLKD